MYKYNLLKILFSIGLLLQLTCEYAFDVTDTVSFLQNEHSLRVDSPAIVAGIVWNSNFETN